MIKIKYLNNNLFHVCYDGEPDGFKNYIYIITHKLLKYARPDFINRGWLFKYKHLDIVKKYFKDIVFENEYTAPPYMSMGESMKLQPYDYQKECIYFILNHDNTLLVAPCGSGKTNIMIGAYLEALKNKKINTQGLIIVKASLKMQWKNEVSKFSDLHANVLKTYSDMCDKYKNKINKLQKKLSAIDIKNKKERKLIASEIKKIEEESYDYFNTQLDKKYDLLIANYEKLASDTEHVLKKLKEMKLDFIACDEIHYAKSSRAKRSKALYELNDAKIKIGATATPITKNPLDIYGIFKFINPELLDTESKFNSRYIKYAGYGRINGFKNMDKLSELISDNILVKTKYEIADQLPELQCIPVYIDLTEKQENVHNHIMDEIDELNSKDFSIRNKCKSENEARLNSDLQEISCKIMALQTFAQELTDSPLLLATSESDYSRAHAGDLDLSVNPKLDICMEIISQIIESGEKVCIFSKFERMQKIIADAVNKLFGNSIGICYVNGSLSSDQRNVEVYDKFRDDDFYKILLMSDAGAEGINLSSCKYMIEYDLATSFAIQTQRQGRLERADSIHSNVIVYQLIGRNSWDEIQLKIIDKKKSYDDNIIKKLANK